MKRKVKLVLKLEDVEQEMDLDIEVPDSPAISDLNPADQNIPLRQFKTALAWQILGVICHVEENKVRPSDVVDETIQKIFLKMGDADAKKYGKRMWDLPTYEEFKAELDTLKKTD